MISLDINFHLLALSSLFIFGLNYCLGSPLVDENGKVIFHAAIFSRIGEGLYKYGKKGSLIHPMVLCPICMASFWGSILYITFTPFHMEPTYFLTWAVHLVALAGLNRILKSFT